MENIEPKLLLDNLKNAKNPVQFIDSRIDADALCSAIALYHMLDKHFGIKLILNYEKNIPNRFFEQLEGFAEIPPINQNIEPKTYDFSRHDYMLYTDSGNLEHVSGTSDFTKPENIKIINIDHHAGNNRFGDFNYVKGLGSACSVLYELLDKWNIQPDKQIANLLLTGIMLDTGFFTYNTTMADDFKYAGQLIDYGAEHYKITWKLTFNETEEDNKLRKLVFDNLVVNTKQKLAYTTITLESVKHMHFKLEDSLLSPSDLIKKIQGIDFAFTVKELEDKPNEFNVSIRGHHENFNCITLARMLNPNSGGHVMAAGATVRANNIDDVIELVIDYANKLRSQDNS